MKKALHFGAATSAVLHRQNPGRSRLRSVFADINMTVIDRLNQDHGYTVHVVGEGVDQKETVTNVTSVASLISAVTAASSPELMPRTFVTVSFWSTPSPTTCTV